MSLTFDEAKHIYRWDGDIVPGVSDILAGIGIVNPRIYNRGAAQRGKDVHLATQLLDEERLDRSALAPKYQGYVTAYERFKQNTGFEVITIEEPLYIDRWRYAGTLDRRGVLYPALKKEEKIILDIKSGVREGWHDIQLMAYSMAFEYPYKRYDLYLTSRGSYKLIEAADPLDRNIWLAALTLYNYRGLRNGKRKG